MNTINLETAKIGDMFLVEREGVIVSFVGKNEQGYICKCSDYPDDKDNLCYEKCGEVSGSPCAGINDMRIIKALTPRTHPKTTYRPFANAEEVMEAIKIHGDWAKNKKGCYVKVTIITQCQVDFAGDVRGFSTILNEGWTFADGTPFGKLEEQG